LPEERTFLLAAVTARYPSYRHRHRHTGIAAIPGAGPYPTRRMPIDAGHFRHVG
jgi:hypothetical protein